MVAFRVQRSCNQFPNNEVEAERFFASYNRAAAFIGCDNVHPINRDDIEVDAVFIRDNAADNYWYTVQKVTPAHEYVGVKFPEKVEYFHFIKIEIE